MFRNTIRTWALLAGVGLLAAACSEQPTQSVATEPEIQFSTSGTPNKQDWKQCQNEHDYGSACNWVTGNVGQQHATFREGDNLPRVLRIPNVLDTDPIILEVGFGFMKGGKTTHDFLHRWNQSQTGANPCVDSSFSMFCTSNSLGSLYTSPSFATQFENALKAACPANSAGITQALDVRGRGDVVIQGKHVANIQIVSLSYSGCTGDAAATLTLSVTPSASGVGSDGILLLFGNHVARSTDWPNGGAGGVQGSPYHMYLNKLDGKSTGSMDLQMAANAILPTPDLSIAKTAASGTVNAGDPISFTMTMQNDGDGAANGVVMTDVLPTGAGLNWSITSQPGGNPCSITGGTLTCNFGSIAAGGTRSVTISSPTTNASCGTYNNTAEFTSTNAGTGNDNASVTVQNCTGSISGMKFHDHNANGTRDMGDEGLENWSIRAYGPNGTTFATSASTNSSGNYSLSGLLPGTYLVCEVLQANWFQSAPAGADNRPNTTDGLAQRCHSVGVTANANAGGIDFGNYQNGSVTVRKYEDLNANAVKDGAEAYRTWAEVSVGAVTQAITNAAAGAVFTPAPGTYTVCEGETVNWHQSQPATNAPGASCAYGNGYRVTVTSGSSHAFEFGNYRMVSIRVRKYEDLAADGSKNGSDAYITWASNIHVFGTSAGASADQHAPITVAADGVTFSVKPGSYSICESMPGGWFQSQPASGVNCGAHTGAAGFGYAVTVQSGDSELSREFGNYRNGSVAVRKFHDFDANGIEDGVDVGLEGWEIRAYQGSTQRGFVLTAASGNGTISGLAPGSYTICELMVASWVQTAPSGNTSCSFDGALGAAGRTVQVLSGQTTDTQVFGNYEPLNWQGETATGFGTTFPGSRNWFMYTTRAQLEAVLGGGKVDLIAGQHYDAGDITVVDNGTTFTITITLHAGFRFADVGNNVKVATWSTLPTGNVNPGQWRDYRASVSQASTSHSFTVGKFNFYGIHADVERLVQ